LEEEEPEGTIQLGAKRTNTRRSKKRPCNRKKKRCQRGSDRKSGNCLPFFNRKKHDFLEWHPHCLQK
jgi:hypothetical protein